VVEKTGVVERVRRRGSRVRCWCGRNHRCRRMAVVEQLVSLVRLPGARPEDARGVGRCPGQTGGRELSPHGGEVPKPGRLGGVAHATRVGASDATTGRSTATSTTTLVGVDKAGDGVLAPIVVALIMCVLEGSEF
jgi:hypothetical protein